MRSCHHKVQHKKRDKKNTQVRRLCKHLNSTGVKVGGDGRFLGTSVRCALPLFLRSLLTPAGAVVVCLFVSAGATARRDEDASPADTGDTLAVGPNVTVLCASCCLGMGLVKSRTNTQPVPVSRGCTRGDLSLPTDPYFVASSQADSTSSTSSTSSTTTTPQLYHVPGHTMTATILFCMACEELVGVDIGPYVDTEVPPKPAGKRARKSAKLPRDPAQKQPAKRKLSPAAKKTPRAKKT
jgi:hypothetical protein